ncbi:alpha/beta hydrolase [Amycolatopsis sp. K13G38]|uniref:Alpha/beta hydrolase n=1 Tax=Amycolatopsis acididurans TaxID=2724524 RepID=A0ABX1JHA6_9PSEU|nr:alpha/beta hydrolase [Amycolatopsis acididurans]NKQ59188.1 alpha/beta hydrolase [Amycolatopsis acididurans]
MDRSILARQGPLPDRTVCYGDLSENVADAWLPAGETTKPLVVFLHGGFWRARYDRTHTRVLCAALRDAGWPVASLEYRRVAGKPDYYTEDIRSALSVVPGQMPGRGVVVAGHSAGGQLALWVASTCPPQGLAGTLALAPVADLAAADQARLGDGAVAEFLGARARDRPDLDPALLPSPDGPVVVIHGDADTAVPVSLSASYVDANPAAKLVVLPGVAHFELIDPGSATWPAVVAGLEALMPG